MVLRPGLRIPLVGAAVVLPISDSLPGGFLGVVTGVSPDGRTLDLVAGGVTAAFDYYEISVPNFEGGDPLPLDAAIAPDAESAAPVPDGPREPLDPSGDSPSPAPAQAAALGPALLDCLGGSASKEIDYKQSLHVAGHFNATITKYKIFGKSIPTGATLDMAFAATVSGKATVTTSGDVSCSASPGAIQVPIGNFPVPMSFYFDPTLQLTSADRSR